jgi:DNA-directed RNA polymerase sigma subunit (sigma70/sigma32)
MHSVILKIDLLNALQNLSTKERLVLHGLFTLNHTEESLGERLQVSRRRIRNLKQDGLSKLKAHFVPKGNPKSLFVE